MTTREPLHRAVKIIISDYGFVPQSSQITFSEFNYEITKRKQQQQQQKDCLPSPLVSNAT